ncbi:MAG: hypothetical protein WC829_21195 [Hyphomicrobium sp.]|jgi:predicted transcriptional regulator
MKAVAAGARKPPSDAAQSSFSSIEAVLATLTNDNRRLIRLLKECGPKTATALARMTSRDSGELGRSLERLHAAGIVNAEKDGRARLWAANPGRLCIEIDLREGWERIEYVPQRRRLTYRREEEH